MINSLQIQETQDDQRECSLQVVQLKTLRPDYYFLKLEDKCI